MYTCLAPLIYRSIVLCHIHYSHHPTSPTSLPNVSTCTLHVQFTYRSVSYTCMLMWSFNFIQFSFTSLKNSSLRQWHREHYLNLFSPSMTNCFIFPTPPPTAWCNQWISRLLKFTELCATCTMSCIWLPFWCVGLSLHCTCTCTTDEICNTCVSYTVCVSACIHVQSMTQHISVQESNRRFWRKQSYHHHRPSRYMFHSREACLLPCLYTLLCA